MTGEEGPVRSCPAGCGRGGNALGELEATCAARLSRTRYSLVRCGCGGLMYLSPAPTSADLKTMYVDEAQFGSEYTDRERVRAILAYVGSALDALTRAIDRPANAPLRVLEVGAGMAWMCRAAKERRADAMTVAQDISPEAAASCPWVDAYVESSVDDPRIAQFAPFDVISMTHVIEHLVEPVAVVARCRALLAPGGLMFVTAPHRPSGWDESTPKLELWRAWSYNHVPAHLQYFSERSMHRLAEAAGCRVVTWSHAHEHGQAFEAWLAPAESSITEARSRRAAAFVRRQAARALRHLRRLRFFAASESSRPPRAGDHPPPR